MITNTRAVTLVLQIFLIVAAGLTPASARGDQEPQSRVARILMVDSYSSTDLWTANLRRAISETFAADRRAVGFETFEFCVRHQPGLVPTRRDVEALRLKIANSDYNLIIVANNSAADLFLNGVIKVPPYIPVLVSAYNGSLKSKIPAGMNLTGIETQLNMHNNILLGMKLLPNLRQINIIMESTSDGDAQLDSLEKWHTENEASLNGVDIHILTSRDLSTRELLKTVSKLPKDSLLLFNSWCSDNESSLENIYTVLPRVRKVFPGLIMGRFSDYIRHGSAGGFVLTSATQGQQAGKIALRIISGERAGDIPVQTGSSTPIFDYPTLKKYHVSLKALPPGSELLNMPPSFWDTYWNEICYSLGGLLLFALCIAIPIRARRQAQRRTAVMFEHLPQYIFVVNRSGRILYKHFSRTANAELEKCMHTRDLPDEIRDRFCTATQKVFETGRNLEFDYNLTGRNRHAEFILLPPSNPFHQKALMWISSDQTELFRAHSEMAQLAEHFQLTLNSIGDGVIATDKEENITLINPVAARMIQITPEQALGRPMKELFRIFSYIDDSPVPSPLTTAISEKRIVELANHTDLIAQDGSRRHIADSAAPLRSIDGDITGGVLVFRDVTDEYNKRDELRRNNATLNSISKIIDFVHFRHDGKTTVTDDSNGRLQDFWPYENGAPIPPDRWISPGDLPTFQSAWNKLIGGQSSELDMVFSSVGAPKRYFSLRMLLTVNEINGKREYCGVLQEVTSSREKELKQAESERVINTLLSMMLKNPDFEGLTPEIVRMAGTEINSDNAYIVIVDNETGERKIHKWVRPGIDPRKVDRLAGMNSLRGFKEGECLLVNDITAPPAILSPHDLELLKECGVKATLNCVILDNGRYCGFLGSAVFDGERHFDDIDLHMFRSSSIVWSLGRDRHRQTEEIENQASFQRQLLENISIPLAIFDPSGKIVGVNQSMRKLIGGRTPELIGRQCNQVLCRKESPMPEECPGLQCLAKKTFSQVELSLFGRQFIVVANPIFDRAGNMTNILESFFDITDLNRQQIELRRAMEQAQAADRAKSYFLATVSHELRTPLNAVIGFSELLQDDDVRKEEAQEYLQSINFAGNALLNLINDVLDLSKLEADQVNIVPVSTDMHSLLGELSAIFKLKAKEKNLTVKMSSHRLDSPLLIDTLRMRQVLLNLVGNAIKFTNEGFVEIDASFHPNPNQKTGTLTIRVSDTGIGISPEKQGLIFDPFIQDDSTRGNQTYEGSGLGLAISQRLIRKMGGEIALESTPGKGSIFSIRIDNVATAEAIYDKNPKAGIIPATTADNRYRMLLVDDVPLNLRVLKVMLNRLGIETELAASGKEALMILIEDQDFTAVLTDLWMPGMNGMELARKINATPGISQIPIFAVTADTQQGIHAAPEFQGALFKPVTLQALRELLEKKLQVKFDTVKSSPGNAKA